MHCQSLWHIMQYHTGSLSCTVSAPVSFILLSHVCRQGINLPRKCFRLVSGLLVMLMSCRVRFNSGSQSSHWDCRVGISITIHSTGDIQVTQGIFQMVAVKLGEHTDDAYLWFPGGFRYRLAQTQSLLYGSLTTQCIVKKCEKSNLQERGVCGRNNDAPRAAR